MPRSDAHAHVHLTAAWPFVVQHRGTEDAAGHEYYAIQARATVSLHKHGDEGDERMQARDCDTYVYIPVDFAVQLAESILAQARGHTLTVLP